MKNNIRGIKEREGEIFLITGIDKDNEMSIVFNFNRNTTNINELIQWFSISEEQLESKVKQLLKQIYGIDVR